MEIISRYVDTCDYVHLPYIGLTEVVSQVDVYLRCVGDYLLTSSPWGMYRVHCAANFFADVYQHADRLDQELVYLSEY